MHFFPKISVITVVYNGAAVLESTIKSVLSQSYQNIEYILIDGDSTDGTKEIYNLYKDKISFIVSEKDAGIYDAMNKALKIATGDYVWFINAGDKIYSDSTLEKIFGGSKNADIYYGDTEEIDFTGKKIRLRRMRYPNQLHFKDFSRGMVVCHQSLIIKRELTCLYDLKFKISADIDWVIEALKKSTHIVNTGLILSKYLIGGTSSNNFFRSNIERFVILRKHYGLIPTIFNHTFYIVPRFFRYYILTKFFKTLYRK